jgi:hypothetical protein
MTKEQPMKLFKVLSAAAAAALSLSAVTAYAEPSDDAEYSTAYMSGTGSTAVNDLHLTAGSAFSWSCDVSRSGYDADVSSAVVMIELTPDDDIQAGTALFRYFDTSADSPNVVFAQEDIIAGTVDTYAVEFSRLAALAPEAADSSFKGDFYLCTSASVTIYVTGTAYSPTPAASSADASSESSNAKDSSSESASSRVKSTAQSKNPPTGFQIAAAGIALAGAAAVTLRRRK